MDKKHVDDVDDGGRKGTKKSWMRRRNRGRNNCIAQEK